MKSSVRAGVLNALAAAPYPVRQAVLGAAYRLLPQRLPGLLPLLAVTARDLPRVVRPLVPDPENALDRPDGLCGLAGSIGVPETIEGYRRGMFLMSHVGPLTWWSSSARVVLFFDQARIDKTTRRLLRNQRFRITFDRAFSNVMEACATPRPGQTPLTWITPRIRALFNAAHADGHAHSVEVWQDDQLVGGVYGLAVGRVFFTESQFHTARDASKVGFAVLNRHLQAWGFALNDGKHPTRYLADVGMTPVTRAEFRALLETWCRRTGKVGAWEVDPALLDDGWTPAEAAGETMADVMPTPSACPWTMDELLTTNKSMTW
jgi:leucyl/phenylalanyl-tRNA--protein transferase